MNVFLNVSFSTLLMFAALINCMYLFECCEVLEAEVNFDGTVTVMKTEPNKFIDPINYVILESKSFRGTEKVRRNLKMKPNPKPKPGPFSQEFSIIPAEVQPAEVSLSFLSSPTLLEELEAVSFSFSQN